MQILRSVWHRLTLGYKEIQCRSGTFGQACQQIAIFMHSYTYVLFQLLILPSWQLKDSWESVEFHP